MKLNDKHNDEEFKKRIVGYIIDGFPPEAPDFTYHETKVIYELAFEGKRKLSPKSNTKNEIKDLVSATFRDYGHWGIRPKDKDAAKYANLEKNYDAEHKTLTDYINKLLDPELSFDEKIAHAGIIALRSGIEGSKKLVEKINSYKNFDKRSFSRIYCFKISKTKC